MSRAKDNQWYMKEYLSEECLCGAEKNKGKAFCYPCFVALPVELRRGVARGVFHGKYPEAFEAAVKYLQEMKW